MTGRLRQLFVSSSFLLLATVGSSPAQATATSRGALPERLEAELPGLMREWNLPGMSIAIIQDGEVSWRRALGVRSVREEAEVDESTVFTAASLTKPVFAYAVLRMCDEGLLDLDTPSTELTRDAVGE